jgi:hypothetical protein
LQLVQNDGTQWTREEGLSDIAAVRFIDLGEPEVEQAGHIIEEESTAGRLSRHLVELKVCTLATGSLSSELTSRTSQHTSSDS